MEIDIEECQTLTFGTGFAVDLSLLLVPDTQDTGDILLASCAQDQLIRIWRLAPRSCDTGDATLSVRHLAPEEEIKMKEKTFSFTADEEGKWSQPMCLLSASMDKTMIVWSPDIDSGVWVEQELNAWEPAVTGGGHFAGIQDMDWDRGGGNFVLTTSLDQTTRLHAPWVLDGKYMGWFEIARPQIHGYDMQCLTMINRYMFASAGDEKVARVFQAPRNFIENLCHISGLNLANELAREVRGL
nr:hypothetical protein BaRGS_018370 [Batillaria attramentaria]